MPPAKQKGKNQDVPDWHMMKQQAAAQAEAIADQEIRALQDRLKSLFPKDVPVTIQLFQPVRGGHLVDVGPRPQGALDGFVFQGNAVGRTGDIFLDKQAAHRYIPLSKQVQSIPRGTFRNEILELEKLRYPGIGAWTTNGPPPSSWIHQLPLAPLPHSLCPRDGEDKYRYPNLGAVYTMSKNRRPSTPEADDLLQRLIFYALRAGEIAQQVRFATLCGPEINDDRVLNRSECRIRVARCLPTSSWSERRIKSENIEKAWEANIDGGICRLVGTLILHHHWWYPYDPVAYEVICNLTNEQEANRIYSLHCSAVPEYSRKQNARGSRDLVSLLKVLSEDIVQIITGYRNLEISDEQRKRLRGAVLTMIRQLCGRRINRCCTEDNNGEIFIGSNLSLHLSKERVPVCYWGCRNWPQDLRETIHSSSFQGPLIRSSTFKDANSSGPQYSRYVLSLLSPNASPIERPHRNCVRTEKRVVRIIGKDALVGNDDNGDQEHFLYWHSRALMKLGKHLKDPEEEI